MRLLERLRHDIARRHLEIFPVAARKRILGEHADHGPRAFEHHGLLLFLRHAESAQFSLRRARADAVVDASVADQVERGNAFGHPRGMIDVRRHLDDAVPDAGRLRPLAAGGQEYLGRRGVRVFFQEMMFGGPDIIESEPVGKLHLFQGVLYECVLRSRLPGAG